MDLVGAWLRQLLRAGTAAAIVPLAMLAALVVVLVGAGGLGGLASLGQLVSGPEISPAERVAPAAGDDLADVPPPAGPAVAAGARPAAAAGERSTGPRNSGGQGGSNRPPARPRPQQPRPPQPQPQPPSVPTPQAPSAPAAPTRGPTLDHGARKLLEEVNETVGEVGTVVREVINSLQQTVERLTGPPRLLR